MARLEVVDAEEYYRRLQSEKRPGAENVLAFYEHRLGVICKDPKMMLIPLDDHLVHRGDGIFETFKFVQGKLYQLDAHLERMRKSCETIFMQPPCPWAEVRKLVISVARAAESEKGVVSIFVGRGPGGFTTDFRECPQSSLYIVIRRLPEKPQSFWENGVSAFKATTPAKQCYLSRIKSVDYLPNVLMKREAIIKGYDYPFCFDEQGYLAEGATENICMVDEQGKLVVPELRSALPGTTLMRALDLIKEEYPFVFRPVLEEELYKAREIILLGTTLDAVSVVRYNNKPIHDVRPGPVSKRFLELIRKDQQENGIPVND